MTVKTLAFTFALITVFSLAKSQSYTNAYYLDKSFRVCKLDKAVYIGNPFYTDSLIGMVCYLKGRQDVISNTIHFADSTLQTLQGKYQSYFADGKVMEEGNYVNGHKNGPRKRRGDKIDITDSSFYNNSNKTIYSYHYYKHRLYSYSAIDSMADTLHYTNYDSTGAVTSETFFKGQRGFRKTYDSGRIKIDTLFSREEKEAAFVGGDDGWKHYLMKNLNARVPINNGAPNGTYTVIIKFIVRKDGTIGDVAAETHFGFGMEAEATRIIENSPLWEPGVQFGRKVNSYRRQPITFVVSQ